MLSENVPEVARDRERNLMTLDYLTMAGIHLYESVRNQGGGITTSDTVRKGPLIVVQQIGKDLPISLREIRRLV